MERTREILIGFGCPTAAMLHLLAQQRDAKGAYAVLIGGTSEVPDATRPTQDDGPTDCFLILSGDRALETELRAALSMLQRTEISPAPTSNRAQRRRLQRQQMADQRHLRKLQTRNNNRT